MTKQLYLMKQVVIINNLLYYLPFCDTPEQRDRIMQEIRSIRKRVSEIEEMTKTEKQQKIKLKTCTIESELNNMDYPENY